MKYITLILLCLLFPFAAQSKVDRTIRQDDKLRVMKISPKGSSLSIRGKKIKEGDIINIKSIPEWEGAEYVILYNLRTNVKHGFCKKEFQSNDSFLKSFIKRNSTSSKGDSTSEGIKEMKKVMNNKFYMIEGELFINSSLPNRETSYFELRIIKDAEVIKIPLPYNPDEPYVIYISKELFDNQGIDISSGARFSVEYITNQGNIPITNYMDVENIENPLK